MDRSICRQLLSLSLLAAILAPCSAAADEARYTLAPDKYGMVLKTPEGKTVFVYMTKMPAESWRE